MLISFLVQTRGFPYVIFQKGRWVLVRDDYRILCLSFPVLKYGGSSDRSAKIIKKTSLLWGYPTAGSGVRTEVTVFRLVGSVTHIRCVWFVSGDVNTEHSEHNLAAQDSFVS